MDTSICSIEQLLLEVRESIKELKTILSTTKEIMTVQDAAQFLSLSPHAVYKLTSRKEIPYYIPGGKKIYFKKTDLENWIYSAKSSSVAEVVDEAIFMSNSLKRKS